MRKVFVERAYAKVNFNLRVLPKRADGYHNLESIFQTVDLYDTLTVTIVEEKGCIVNCDSMVLPEKNTLTLAYQAFWQIAGTEVPGVVVTLEKGIPSGGGLGGGSSDAAALIRVLEKVCGVKLSDEQLDYVAGQTGSDVFFFMHCDQEGRGCALVSGRGEYVKKIAPRDDLYLLFVFPETASSTKEAYALVDEWFADGKNKAEEKYPDISVLEEIYHKVPVEWSFKNTFTLPLCEKNSEFSHILCELKKGGAEYADMSGSGSTFFGVFTYEQQAKFCKNMLAGIWKCKIARLV